MNYKQLSEDIVKWLKDYSLNSGLLGYCCGVSGGVDSAVISTLCAKTNLPLNAYGIPINSHVKNNKNSELQLNWLKKNFHNVKTEIVDLSSTFITIKDGRYLSELAKANTKCRLRHVFLYAEANTHNLLICLSGNKIEDLGVGFATKGGDLNCGDISPIADLTKTQVWELAKYLGIPQEIIDAPPTDGLWDDVNHTDERQIGATYPELEWAMEYLETHSEYQGIDKREREIIDIYKKFNTKNKHKMLPIPVFKVDKSKY